MFEFAVGVYRTCHVRRPVKRSMISGRPVCEVGVKCGAGASGKRGYETCEIHEGEGGSIFGAVRQIHSV